MAERPRFTNTNLNDGITFVNADSTTPKDLIATNGKDLRVTQINLATDDTAAIGYSLYWHDGAVAYLLGRTELPAGSGTDGTNKAVNMLNTTDFPGLEVDNNGNVIFELKDGEKLQVAPLTAVTAAKTTTIVATGHEY